jgi:hypothetical protein
MGVYHSFQAGSSRPGSVGIPGRILPGREKPERTLPFEESVLFYICFVLYDKPTHAKEEES